MASPANAVEPYVDDFVGSTVRPEWRIEKEDTNRYGLVDGNYLLLVSNTQGPNKFVKTIDGSGDFVVEMTGTATFTPAPYPWTDDWQGQACIIMGVEFDKDTRIRGAACTNRSYLWKTVEGETNTTVQPHGTFKRFLLRLAKNGVQYSVTSIVDGNEIKLGSQFMPRPPKAVYFGAYNAHERVAEGGVMVDRISITPK